MTPEELLTRLSRQTISIGSSDACAICLPQDGVPPVGAEIVHQGGGKLSFIPGGAAPCFAGEKQLQPHIPVPFDFSIPYRVGAALVPNAHPDLCLMVMSRGHVSRKDDQLTIGRDPERCHIVMSSPGVSGCHATFYVRDQRLSVLDHQSTSGTWLAGQRLAPNSEHLIDERAIVAIGPLPLPAQLVRQLWEATGVVVAQKKLQQTEVMPMRTQERSAMPSRLPEKPTLRHRTVMGTIKMAHAAVHTVGRTPDNDIVLDYAQVSGRHAKLTTVGEDVFIEDAGSELGTQVRGSRLHPGQRARISDGERVMFGPMPALLKVSADKVDIIVEDHEGWAGRPLYDIAAAGITVEVRDRDNPKVMKRLLDKVNFRALPGDLVALMGPSGSGKTTLLHALTGYIRPQQGEVLVNGRPLPQVFESLRGSIGYVPQDDIIHPELTVFEAVRYSARFRLPSDYSAEEIDQRVHATLSQLGLESVAHLQIGRPEAKVLSGGQRKRVNIAMELVTDPVLLFLDEPTSGLAADDTTSLIDLLARLARESGKTIIATIHQPARDEYEKFNLALILGHGGIPLYFGPSVDAYHFFEAWRGPLEARGIANPRDMFAELKERQARFEKEMPGARAQEVRISVSRAYEKEYEQSAVLQAMIHAERTAASQGANTATLPPRTRPRGQLRLLLSRYFKIKARDRVGSAILLLQAPLIGLMLSLVFGSMKNAVPYWCLGALNELAARGQGIKEASAQVLSNVQATTDHSGALFFLVVAAVWFGTSNAAREIVAERAIFRREKMVNLGVTNYLFSKFIVLSALSLLQCLTLLSIVFWALGLSGGGAAYFTSLGMMGLTAISSVALGLLLSAVVTSAEAAMALTPIALIPQVVLGGLMVPVTTSPWLKWAMYLMPSRWGFEGVVRPERVAVQQSAGWQIQLGEKLTSVPDYIDAGVFQCAIAQMESSNLMGAWGFAAPAWLAPSALAAMSSVLLLLVALILQRRH